MLEFLPSENFNEMLKHIDLGNYISTKKNDFEKLLKKLSSVNSKDSKYYKEILKNILENYFPIIVKSFGDGTIGTDKLMNFLEMPKSDKHTFLKRDSNGKIIAKKKEVTVNADGTRNEKEVEFELSDQLSIFPQKERRDLIKKNEEFIKSKIEGDSERKEINFLRILFSSINPQEIQRTLVNDKEKFIKYYDKFNKSETIRLLGKLKELKETPGFESDNNLKDHAKKIVDLIKNSLTIDGIPKPGIMSYYAIFNKGDVLTSGFYKFAIEDLRNPNTLSELKNFYEKVELKKRQENKKKENLL